MCGQLITFVDLDLHLWKAIYICGKQFTFVEQVLHLLNTFDIGGSSYFWTRFQPIAELLSVESHTPKRLPQGVCV